MSVWMQMIMHACPAVALSLLAGWSLGAEPEFVIQIKDHHFVPAVLHIPSGVKVRIVLDNQDAIAEEFDSHSLNREKHVAPMSRETLFIGPLDPGRYLYEGESDDPGGAALGVIVVP